MTAKSKIDWKDISSSHRLQNVFRLQVSILHIASINILFLLNNVSKFVHRNLLWSTCCRVRTSIFYLWTIFIINLDRCFGKIVLSDHSCSIDEKIYLWFYLSVINQCLQYSTCPVEVEGNAFHTKLDCESACRASNILSKLFSLFHHLNFSRLLLNDHFHLDNLAKVLEQIIDEN